MVGFNPSQQFNGNTGKKVTKQTRDIRAKVLDLKTVLVSCLTPERLWLIAEQIIELAEAGNMEAATWIVDRVIGKPTKSVEITTADSASDEAPKVVLVDWRRHADAIPESN